MKIVQVESLGVSKQELDNAKQEFESLGHQYTYYTDIPKDEDELIARMKDAEIVTTSKGNRILTEPEIPERSLHWHRPR